MKIVLLQDDFPPESKGGAGMLVGSLAKALKQNGHEVVVIAATQDVAKVGKGEWEGVVVYRIYSDYHERWRGYRSLYNWSTIPTVKKLLQELGPDVVHAHNIHYHLSYASVRVAKQYTKKVLLTAHDVMLFHYGSFFEHLTGSYKVYWWTLAKRFTKRFNPLRGLGIHWYLRNVPIIAVSREQAKALEANGFHADVVYNGIEPTTASAVEIEQFIKEHELVGKKVVLFVGGVSNKLKGSEQVLDMFPVVRQLVPEAALLIAGTTGNSHDGIIYTGWLSPHTLRAAYGASNVVVFPSIGFDVFGLVNLEAMAAHKPVVATCFGGAPEIVVDGETGYVVDPRNTQQFAQRVAELLLDEEKAHEMGEKGHARLLQQFSAAHMARAYERRYASDKP
ncbi:MAG: hypothetical protein QG621_536 [Patescibacteria group bacterium]|jgi:glycosyltransferase involved in cell wall biosynthesis|nr:hypothetical protein [Patescibacteria group bacterium]